MTTRNTGEEKMPEGLRDLLRRELASMAHAYDDDGSGSVRSQARGALGVLAASLLRYPDDVIDIVLDLLVSWDG